MKISFTKPANLNGATLLEELVAAGVSVAEENGKPKWVEVDADGVLWADIAEKDKAKAETVVAAHNG
jgi:sugar lactone lactonase YvrE